MTFDLLEALGRQAFLIIIVWVVCVLLAGFEANRKGYDPGTWGCIAFLLGPLAIIGAIMLPNRPRCPHCREPVRSDATACAKCGRDVPDA